MGFLDSVRKTLQADTYNDSVTENGAHGYRTSGKELLDLNFAVSSLRNASEEEIEDRFAKAYYEDRRLAVKWLFFAADVRGGMGERRLFRTGLRYLANNHPETAGSIISLVPEYSRWDNLLVLLDTPLAEAVIHMIQRQLEEDLRREEQGGPVSLCAKWLPSINASSRETRRKAYLLASGLGMTGRGYRQALTKLRRYLKLTETYMSENRWEEIDYKAVPSRANLIYNKAFLRNDEERRRAYLESVKSGGSIMHAEVLYPHDIVHRYFEANSCRLSGALLPEDDTLELLWKSLPDFVCGNGNTLCVADGSGSMMARIGNTSVTCLAVAAALAIYFAERCSGPFHGRYITFSCNPQLVDLGKGHTLREKIEIALRHDEVSNTDIEAVFELILATAQRERLRQEEMPAAILILSDMEFDAACVIRKKDREGGCVEQEEKLFEGIEKRFQEAGYCLPRLVFWNIAGRTGTIPMKVNKMGVALVSGFSVTLMKMVLHGQADPYLCLTEQLDAPRYHPVEKQLTIPGILR